MLSLLFGSLVLGGCAKYATTGETISRIEKRAYMGISEQEFKEKIPIARLIMCLTTKNFMWLWLVNPVLYAAQRKHS